MGGGRAATDHQAPPLEVLLADFVALRKGVVIPGSRNVAHIRDNLDILDFRLSDEEMVRISELDKGERYYHRTDGQLVQFASWRPDFETE